MSEDENEIHSEALFFTKRATFVPKVSAEEYECAAKLMNESTPVKLQILEKKKVQSPTKYETKIAVKKLLSESEENSLKMVNPCSSSVRPRISATAKRRLKKLQAAQADELKFVEAENRKILKKAAISSILSEVEEVDDTISENNVMIILTFSYMSKISRLKCFENETFSTIFPKVADLYKVKASELLLCLQDQNIKMDDTPKSLSIKLNDIIECIPYKADENFKENDDENKLKLIFQSNNSKDKIDLLIHKLENMQEVMKMYSEKRNIPLNALIFEFDGETIEGTETPQDLDMESGSCIDVKVFTNPTEIVTNDVEVISITNPLKQTSSVIDLCTTQSRSRGRGRSKCRGRGRSRGRGRGRSRRNNVVSISDANVITVEDDSDIEVCD